MRRAALVIACFLATLFSPAGLRRSARSFGAALCGAGLALACAGCAHPVDGLVASLNASQQMLVSAHDGLEAEHRRARDEAIEAASSAEDARQRVAKVHAEYAPRWAIYTRVRLTWIGAAALAHAAMLIDRSGGRPDLTPALAEAGKMSSALTDLAKVMKGAP